VNGGVNAGNAEDGGAEVVAAARGWIGTPYVHGASVRGAGCDCLGLLRGLWREMVGAEPVAVPAYTADWGEPGRQELLWAAARAHLGPAAPDWAAGDILLFRMKTGGVAKHLGLLTEAGAGAGTDAEAGAGAGARFLHAYARHGVVEGPLSVPWARRVVARFRLPGT
jgi:NlpC/P60 family putative phage cell wall peptidase